MSKNIFAILAALGIAGSLAFGCNSSTTESDDGSSDSGTTCKKGQKLSKGKCVATKSTDDNGTDSKGDDDDDDTTTKDSGTKGDSGATKDSGGGGSSCFDPANVSGYKSVALPTSHANQAGKCTDGNISSFATACGNDLAADKTDTCFAAIKAAPAACVACLFSSAVDGGAANLGPFYTDADGDQFNVPGCLSIASGIAGCGEKYADFYSCYQQNATACDKDCPTDDGDVAYSACLDDAESGCKTKTGLDSACETAVNGAAGAKCFIPDLADAGAGVAEATWVTNLAATFCK